MFKLVGDCADCGVGVNTFVCAVMLLVVLYIESHKEEEEKINKRFDRFSTT